MNVGMPCIRKKKVQKEEGEDKETTDPAAGVINNLIPTNSIRSLSKKTNSIRYIAGAKILI
jgi:hypothetical protein